MIPQEIKKRQFILTLRGPDFTEQFCERHFPNLLIIEVKARTVDRSGSKMIFISHGRQLRTTQWISAVDNYNRQAPVHLKIHWAGSTEAEHIIVGEGYRRLSTTPAYKHITRKDTTYMEWKEKSVNWNDKFKDFQPPVVDAPGDSSGASSKRSPKRVYENMDVDKIYKDMNIDPESPKHKHARTEDYETESDEEVLEPVQPRVVPLADVPAQVIHEVQPQIVREVQAPVVREVQPPVQSRFQPPVQPRFQPPVQSRFQPPVQSRFQPPVQPRFRPPVQPRVAPLSAAGALMQQYSMAMPGQSGVSPYRAWPASGSPYRVWPANQMFYFVPAPIVNEPRAPVVNEVRVQVVDQVAPPVINEAQEPVVNEVQPQVVDQVAPPVINEAQEPVDNEAQEPVDNEAQEPVNNEFQPPVDNEVQSAVDDEDKSSVDDEDQSAVDDEDQSAVDDEVQPSVIQEPEPVINEPRPFVVNEPQPPPPVNNPPPAAQQHVTGDLVSLAALTAFMQPVFALVHMVLDSAEH